MVRLAPLVALALTSCATAPEAPPQMDGHELLVRLSLDLRGVRPTAEEHARLEADPDALDALVDDYLHDPRFGDRVRDLWSEVYLTRTETYGVTPEQFGVDPASFYLSIGAEPLRILQRVAEEDLPYTEVVTADWTMANETTAAMWPLDYDGPGWQVARYTDGRPHAGVLSTNGMWWRYGSTDSNANRKRANQVSRIFLCNDYLVRPIDFDRNVNLLDQEAIEDALRSNPGCVNCHVSLDPLASYFYGFFYTDPGSAVDIVGYHPEREGMWRDRTGVAPAFYGEPGYTLTDLGHQIAGDHRFVECAVEQTWELYLRRDRALLDEETLIAHRDAFIAGDLTLRALIRSVITSPQYRSGPTDLDGFVPRKMATATLLASQIEDLTGFAWTRSDLPVLETDAVGFQTLAGGADGTFVTSTARFPNATLMLVQERLAEAAAMHVASSDAAGGDRLFTAIDFTETPDTDRDAMVAQIQALHWRIFGRRVAPDGPEVQANLSLWEAVYAVEGDPVTAWAGVLAALLRDPDFLFY